LNRIELARRIFELSHITGEFELRSGATSDEYFDKYLFEADPSTLVSIAAHIYAALPEQLFSTADFLAGLEMGGIPVVTMLSQTTGKPALFVRKQAKSYGTRKLAEGQVFTGKRLLIVEDVVSSGGQIILSSNDLRQQGAHVTDAICIIDRESGGLEKLATEGIKLHSLFTMSDIKKAVSTL